MDATLNKLINIDKQARNMLDEAEEYKNSVINHLGQDIEQLKDYYSSKASRRISLIRESEDKSSHEADDEMVRRYAALTKLLEDSHALGHDELVTQLFNRCIGR